MKTPDITGKSQRPRAINKRAKAAAKHRRRLGDPAYILKKGKYVPNLI